MEVSALDMQTIEWAVEEGLRLYAAFAPDEAKASRKHMIDKVVEAWAADDIGDVLMLLGNDFGIPFVGAHIEPLKELGLFEWALLDAFKMKRTNLRCHYDELCHMFSRADPKKLRDVGGPLPNRKRFTLYRGVAGRGRARRVQGFSWTECPHMAAWFAMRFSSFLENPAVFRITVSNEQILTRLPGRGEKEYVLNLPLPVRPKQVKPMPKPQKRSPENRIQLPAANGDS